MRLPLLKGSTLPVVLSFVVFIARFPEQVPEQDHAVAGGVRDHLHADGQAVELEGHDGGHQGRQPLLPRHIRGRREKARRMVSFTALRARKLGEHQATVENMLRVFTNSSILHGGRHGEWRNFSCHPT